MIPKIIHYCWFGGKPEPESVCHFVEQWRKLMPEWEIRRWNESNFSADRWIYAREAMAMGEWAFVSDVCRMYALHEFGGVYLDTDMELLQPLDSFIDNKSFVGYESTNPGTAILGTMPNAPLTEKFLDYYRTHHFVNMWGHPVRRPNTEIFKNDIFPLLKSSEMPTMYQRDVFYPRLNSDGSARTKANTAGIHHFEASWRGHRTLASRIRVILRGLRVRYFSNLRR